MKSRRISWGLVLGFIALLSPSLSAQQKIYSGVVRDLNTYREIGYVNIFLENTNIGTTSDFDGRFSLAIPASQRQHRVVFQHIAYEPLFISADSLAKLKQVFLQPRVINLRGVTIEGEGVPRPGIEKDLPQVYSIVEAKNFDIRGYTDAGDLLRMDHSVQVGEELSGKKTIAIRGGNSDEVVVLYNGVKLNNTFDNVFDLSLIDLEDVRRFEIIKGSNTALYGPEAFSGVINIVPKSKLDYSLRFQQRFGTYRSGNWGIQVNPDRLLRGMDNLTASYSFRRGASRRSFISSSDEADANGLENSSEHHTATISYDFGAPHAGLPRHSIGGLFLHTTQDYDNFRDHEKVRNRNQLYSLRYQGAIAFLKNLDAKFSFKELEEAQSLRSETGFINRDIRDRSFYGDIENSVKVGIFDLLLAYQYQQTTLDFGDERSGPNITQLGLESASLQRRHHGLVSILKMSNDTGLDYLQTFDLGISLRHDFVTDTQSDAQFRDVPNSSTPPGKFGENQWDETIFKFSLSVSNLSDQYAYSAFLKFGSNTKFPSLFQQISSPSTLASERRAFPNLNPEKNNSIEIGGNLSRQIPNHPSVYGWGLSAVYFKNLYENKFRTIIIPGIPVAFYDNVLDANISGIEIKPSVYFFKKKFTIEFGLSKYSISDKSAFPFKSDLKRTLNFFVDHAGYALQVLWFSEGDQIGWLRQLDGRLAEITLDSFTNLDVHLSKTLNFGDLKVFVNASGRNLLNKNDQILEGLAIRDRRYYLTIGAQY